MRRAIVSRGQAEHDDEDHEGDRALLLFREDEYPQPFAQAHAA